MMMEYSLSLSPLKLDGEKLRADSTAELKAGSVKVQSLSQFTTRDGGEGIIDLHTSSHLLCAEIQ